jgi:hypothetical protein
VLASTRHQRQAPSDAAAALTAIAATPTAMWTSFIARPRQLVHSRIPH